MDISSIQSKERMENENGNDGGFGWEMSCLENTNETMYICVWVQGNADKLENKFQPEKIY